MDIQTLALLFLGHLVTDINQGALPALLPFLISEYQLSYTAAGFVVFACNIASTVVQPVFGHLADRISTPWLLPAGIFLAGAGLAVTGIAPGYAWVLAAVMVSGIGVAAFHPQGARLVSQISGEKQATAMSLFGVGGTLGFALGPLIVTAAVLHWGLKGSIVLAVPTSLAAVLLAWYLSTRIMGGGRARIGRTSESAGTSRDAWGPFARLTALVVTRAIMFYGLNTFVPLYWIHVLHRSQASGAMALSLFALTNVLGGLVGGPLADRFGHTRIALGGFCALIPLAPLLVEAQSEPAALAMLVLIGMALSTTYSPLLILGQKYLPNHIGFSSGITLGVAVTIGGVTTPLLGQVADRHGLWATLAVLALVPILSAGLALTLPRPEAVHTHPRPAA